MEKDNSGKRNCVLRDLEGRNSRAGWQNCRHGWSWDGGWPQVSLQNVLGPHHGWDLRALEGLKQEGDRARSTLRGGGSGCSRKWGCGGQTGRSRKRRTLSSPSQDSVMGSEPLPGPPGIPLHHPFLDKKSFRTWWASASASGTCGW